MIIAAFGITVEHPEFQGMREEFLELYADNLCIDSRLFEGSPLPMTVTDPKTLHLLDANDAAVNLFGYTRAEFIALRGPDLYVPKDETEREEVEGLRVTERGGVNYVKAGPLSFRKKE